MKDQDHIQLTFNHFVFPNSINRNIVHELEGSESYFKPPSE